MFKSTEMAASVSSDAGGFPPHLALPDALPGVVEIWEPEKPDERREIEGWDAPFDLVNETSPRVKLARRIARHVRGLIARGAAQERRCFGSGAPARAAVRGDHPRAQARGRRGGRRRSPGAHRAYRGDGSDGARRRAAAAAGRSGARHGAAQPAVRLFATTSFSPSPGTAAAPRCATALEAKGRRRQKVRRRRGSPRRVGPGRTARDAVCVLRKTSGRGRRAEKLPRPARRRGQRCARRIPQSRARLRAARHAFAARLCRLAA